MSTLALGPSDAFDNTIGALCIGIVVSFVLYGISVAQTIRYSRTCQQDNAAIKSLVFTVCILDTLHVALVTHAFYVQVVPGHGNILILVKPVWSTALNLCDSVFVNLFVRIFFSYRIRQFSQTNAIPALIFILSLGAIAVGIYYSVEIWRATAWTDLTKFSWAMYLGFGFEMTADSIIAVYMALLLKQRYITEFASTNALLNTLMAFSLYTGAFTVVCYVLCLVTFSTMPDNFIFQSIYLVLCQLYTNSMLGSLNARQSLRRRHLTTPRQLNSPLFNHLHDSSVHELDVIHLGHKSENDVHSWEQ